MHIRHARTTKPIFVVEKCVNQNYSASRSWYDSNDKEKWNICCLRRIIWSSLSRRIRIHFSALEEKFLKFWFHSSMCVSLFKNCVGFEFLAAVVTKSSIVWDITACSQLKVNRRFGRTCSACCLLHAGFFLGLFFEPEYGYDIFLRNVGLFSADCTALYPRG
jgi:hypothetical protein